MRVYCVSLQPLKRSLHRLKTRVRKSNPPATKGLKSFISHANETIDLTNVPVIHSNDTKMALGSHLDRHANIGAGHIGMDGFRGIINHAELREKAFILKTPDDNAGDHRRDVEALKGLVK